MEQTKDRRKLGLAILISLVVHLVVAYSLAAFGSVFTPPLPAEETPSVLTIVDLSATPPPAVARNPAFMETAPSKESAEKPKDQTFESNANSIAASNRPATGDLPLPSQDGKERPFINLETHQYSLPSEGSKPQPETPPATRPSTPLPVATPKPTAKPSEPPKESPKPSEPPKTTPVPTPEPEQLAMLTATPPPPINAPDETEPSPPPAVEASVAPPAVRPRPEQPASSYQAQKQETRIAGSISNRGPSSVNAVGTPLGRYQKEMYDSVGKRWYKYTAAKRDLIGIGTIKLTFWIDRAGRVTNLKVVSNTANEAFASVCLQSVQELKLPPIPEEIASTLPPEGLPGDLTFVMYAN
jgi:outer membrane biosynthesis protein TonB